MGVKTKQTVKLLLLSIGSHFTGMWCVSPQPTLTAAAQMRAKTTSAAFYLRKHNYPCLH